MLKACRSGRVICSSAAREARDMGLFSNAFVWSVGTSSKACGYYSLDVALDTTKLGNPVKLSKQVRENESHSPSEKDHNENGTSNYLEEPV